LRLDLLDLANWDAENDHIVTDVDPVAVVEVGDDVDTTDDVLHA